MHFMFAWWNLMFCSILCFGSPCSWYLSLQFEWKWWLSYSLEVNAYLSLPYSVFPSGHLPYCNKLILTPKNRYVFSNAISKFIYVFIYFFIFNFLTYFTSLKSFFYLLLFLLNSKSVNVKCIALKSCWSVSIVCISAANLCDCRPLELIMAV